MVAALPDYLSVSRIKVFLQCPRRYRLQYVDRAEAAFTSIALAFGRAFHAAIDEHLLRADVPREELHQVFREELERQVQQNEVPVLFDDEEDNIGRVIETGTRMLDAFVERVPHPEKVIGVEIPFRLNLSDEETGEVLRVPLVGAMDALVVEAGANVVWELKSGKRRWSGDQLAFDTQPTAYLLAARELGYEVESARLIVTTKSQVPDVQSESVCRSRSDERDLFETAGSVLRAIEASVDHPIRSWQCKSCPYSGACR